MSVPRRWLQRLLDEATAPQALPSSTTRPGGAPRSPTHARRLASAMTAARGLAFGAPQLRQGQTLSRGVVELEAVVRLLAVVVDVAATTAAALGPPAPAGPEPVPARAPGAGTSSSPSTSSTASPSTSSPAPPSTSSPAPPSTSSTTRAAVAAACAIVYGADHAAAAEDARLLSHHELATAAREERVLLALERELARRRYLAGNPLLGLTLHRAFSALDARALVQGAVDVLCGVVVDAAYVARVQGSLAAERLAVAAAIAGLSEWREQIDADAVRQASLWQVEHLGLPRSDTARLVEVVRRPPALSRLLPLVPDDARGRVHLHTTLAAAVDGRVSPEERAHLRALGDALALSPATQARTRRRVIDFVKRHADDFNPLAEAAGFAAVDPPLSVRLARGVFENADALWREIRETGDLGVLLARRAAGQRLSDDEHRRRRSQLIDVVKAVPSLAVFALPGGFVLVPLLLKVLPFDLRTSAFRDLDDFHAFARDARDSLTPQERTARQDRHLPPPARWRG